MQKEKKAISFAEAELKINGEKRIIEMYSAKFGNVDLGNDVIHDGAFERTLREHRDDSSKEPDWDIPMLWQHRTDSPIGNPVVLHEDEQGLYSKDYIPDTGPGCTGTRAIVLVQNKVVRGASIGYAAVDFRYDNEDVRHLYDIELYERSVVTFGMNPKAGAISASKGVLQLLSPGLQQKVNKVLMSDVRIEKFESAVCGLLDLIADYEPQVEEKKVIPYRSFPTDTDSWDGPKEVSAAEVDDLRVMCTWYDSENADIKSAYKLPHHRAGNKHVVWSGVTAAMAALLGARGGVNIPDADREGVYKHLARHYENDFDREPPAFKSASPEGQVHIGDLRSDVKDWIEKFKSL